MTIETTKDTVKLRKPTPEDGRNIWELVRACPPLDVNSCYSYLLLTEHFRDTCVIAEAEGKMLGFVSGYLLPNKQNTLFIWQVAVSNEARGLGLAKRMLQYLRDSVEDHNVTCLETTITPSNTASQRLFQSLAKTWETECEKTVLFSSEHFGDGGHEPEECYRIGPWK